MIFDVRWNNISEAQLKKESADYRIIIFGASLRNTEILKVIPVNNIDCICDNDETKWDTYRNEIQIKGPKECTGEIIITALEDYRNVIPQLHKLGYKKIYYFMRESTYDSIYKTFIEEFRGEKKDYLLKNNGEYFKYIHIILDDKFFLPLEHLLERKFDMQEHAFVIFGLNAGNRHNKYGTWKKYQELSKKYQNVLLIEDGCVIPGIVQQEDALLTVLPALRKAQKIIFQGEWLTEEMRNFFSQGEQNSLIKEKGVWVVWAGNPGTEKRLRNNIESVLKHCKVVVLKKTAESTYRNLCENIEMPNHYRYMRGANYVWAIERPSSREQGKNVLLGQSCYEYNNHLDTLYELSKYKGKIDVYCIGAYGSNEYIDIVRREGKQIFGDNFHMVDSFMEYTEYVEFLNKMDVAVFGMELAGGNNTLQILFWLKKKVYLKKSSPIDVKCKDMGYHVYNYYNIKNETIDSFFEDDICDRNYLVSAEVFDKEKIIERWRGLFELDMDNLP